MSASYANALPDNGEELKALLELDARLDDDIAPHRHFLATRWARPSGPLARTSKPTLRSLSTIAGSFRTSSVSRATRSTIAAGVPAAAYMP